MGCRTLRTEVIQMKRSLDPSLATTQPSRSTCVLGSSDAARPDATTPFHLTACQDFHAVLHP